MLTHGNIASNQNYAVADFAFDSNHACISFLPLSHITARALDYVMYNHGAQVAYCSQFDKLPQAMREVRPTVIVGVPRVYEKIRQAVEARSAESPVKKRLLSAAISVGARHAMTVYSGRRPSSLLWNSPTNWFTPKCARPSAAASKSSSLAARLLAWIQRAGLPPSVSPSGKAMGSRKLRPSSPSIHPVISAWAPSASLWPTST